MVHKTDGKQLGGKGLVRLVLCVLIMTAILFPAKTFADGNTAEEPVGQLKILARYNDSMDFYDGHVYLLFTSYQDGVEFCVEDLYGGYEISDQYYTDINKSISYGSNHTGNDTDPYFTFNPDMNSVTLNRGEIVTIGMYRGFELSVLEAAMGSVLNSTLIRTSGQLTDAAKTTFVKNFFQYLLNGTPGAENELTELITALERDGFDPMKLLDGTVEGGVCFNRELYNQKLEWDQYENVTYEIDITESQLRKMEAALQGNLNRFSILKNSCATVALRAWNAAVGIDENGEPTEYYLETSGDGIFAFMDAPKTVKEEIINKLPGYYLNNSEGVAEPNAGYQDETGWVYVSAPEVLDGADRQVALMSTETVSESGSPKARMTISARRISEDQLIPHGSITFTPYEDMDLPVSFYHYYKPTEAYIALMEDYRDHPEKYTQDPALYSEELDLGDREAYFEDIFNGEWSEPAIIHLNAGESITLSNYSYETSDFLTIKYAIENGDIYKTSPMAQELVRQMDLYYAGEEIDGPLAFDSLVGTFTQIFLQTRLTGVNPANGYCEGGQDINREVYNQFRRNDSQLPNYFYTVELTEQELESFISYVSDPANNYYAFFTKSCGTAPVDLWNTTLADRPELKLSSNMTGFVSEPQSLYVEIGALELKTGQKFTGTGEGGGQDHYPRIAPGYLKEKSDWLFRDIKEKSGDWVYDAAKYVYDHKIMTGMSKDYFGAAETLSRAQFATIIYRMSGEEGQYKAVFPDVKESDWFGKPVSWANQAGVITGYKNGTFGPADNITREQLAVMLYRYAKYKEYDVSEKADLGKYPDSGQVSDWAADAMQWAVGGGIITGKNGTYLDPAGNASRAECAAMVMRFLKKYE